LTKQIV